MRASRHPLARRLAADSQFVGPATVSGQLYNLGAYPGLVETSSANAKVHGEVVKLTNLRSLAWLDDYEGCGARSPHPHDYKRKIVSAWLADGGTLQCWVYVYQGGTVRMRIIPDGRFKPL